MIVFQVADEVEEARAVEQPVEWSWELAVVAAEVAAAVDQLSEERVVTGRAVDITVADSSVVVAEVVPVQ